MLLNVCRERLNIFPCQRIGEKAESKTVSRRQQNWWKNNDEYPQRDSYPAWIRHRHTQKEKTFISPHTAYHCNYTAPRKSVSTGSAFRIHLQCGCWMDTPHAPTVRYNRKIVNFLSNFLFFPPVSYKIYTRIYIYIYIYTINNLRYSEQHVKLTKN